MKQIIFFVMMLMASYGLNAQTGEPVTWFKLGNFDIQPGATATTQIFDDVTPNNIDVYNLDLKIIQETNNNLCNQGACTGTDGGGLSLNQKNATDDLRITANAMHQYVIELSVVDANEIISVFTESEASQGPIPFELVSGAESVVEQSSGLPAIVGASTYNSLTGISIQGNGYGADAATLTIVTDPATDLIIRYQGIGSTTKYGNFKIGRLEPEINKIASFLLTDATNAPTNIPRYSEQGLAIDYSTNEVFTSSSGSIPNSSYYIARFQIENDGSWTYLERSDILAAINATNIYSGMPASGEGPYSHIGAIDFHDEHLWIGLFGSGSVLDAVAKVRVNNFNPNDGLPSFVVEAVYYTNEVSAIDATAFDGTHLWVSAYQGIYRFAASDFGTNTLNNGKRLNAHPFRLGGDFNNPAGYDQEPDHYLYSQGLRVIPGDGTTPDRLLSIFPNFVNCNNTTLNIEYCGTVGGFVAAPFTGLYEFDISGDIEEERTPTRIWHIPHDDGGVGASQHLEGFDFVPGQPNQIYLADSGAKEIDVLEITQLYTNNGGNCPANLNITTTYNSGSNVDLEASNTITASNIINSGAIVDYDAGAAITLTTGFHTKYNSHFHAFIDGCGGAFIVNENDGNSTFNHSTTMLKTTASTISDGVTLRNYPNPFTGTTTIEYTLPQAQKVSMTISDLSGKTLAYPLQDKMSESGVHTLQFDATSLSAGMYFCTLQTTNTLKTHKITVFE